MSQAPDRKRELPEPSESGKKPIKRRKVEDHIPDLLLTMAQRPGLLSDSPLPPTPESKEENPSLDLRLLLDMEQPPPPLELKSAIVDAQSSDDMAVEADAGLEDALRSIEEEANAANLEAASKMAMIKRDVIAFKKAVIKEDVAALKRAVRRGDAKEAQRALAQADRSIDIDEILIQGHRLLHFSVEAGNASMIKVLLLGRADIDCQDKNHTKLPPLLMAVANGNLEITDLLIEHGAHLVEEDSLMSVLHIAAREGHVEFVKKFLSCVDVNLVSESGYTPLMLAAYHGNRETTKILLDHGASVYQQHRNEGTALQMAAQSGHREAVEMLLERIDVDWEDDNDMTLLQLSAQGDHIASVMLLLAIGASPDWEDELGSKTEDLASSAEIHDYLKRFRAARILQYPDSMIMEGLDSALACALESKDTPAEIKVTGILDIVKAYLGERGLPYLVPTGYRLEDVFAALPAFKEQAKVEVESDDEAESEEPASLFAAAPAFFGGHGDIGQHKAIDQPSAGIDRESEEEEEEEHEEPAVLPDCELPLSSPFSPG